MQLTPTLMTDGYKIDHRRQYPKETTLVYSNFTPRKSRVKNVNEVVVFGMQYYIISTLIEIWNEQFFKRPINEITEEFMEEMINYTLSIEAAEGIEIFKDPKTDDGMKKSAKGLMRVTTSDTGYKLIDQQTWAGEEASLLQTVFYNGELVKETTLSEIRERLKNYEKVTADVVA